MCRNEVTLLTLSRIEIVRMVIDDCRVFMMLLYNWVMRIIILLKLIFAHYIFGLGSRTELSAIINRDL